MSNQHQNWAVLVGVDDYRSFDPSGGHDLRGGVNDALAYAQLCARLGFDPGRVRTLKAPAAGANEANAAQVRDALEWLIGGLARGEAKAGLFLFSGQGAWTQAGLELYPTDTRLVPGSGLQQVIRQGWLEQLGQDRWRAEGAAGEPLHNLTMILDIDHASLGGVRVQHGDRGLLAARVISARRPPLAPGQTPFAGTWRGRLSWAVETVLDQWRGPRRPTYHDVTRRAGSLLHETGGVEFIEFAPAGARWNTVQFRDPPPPQIGTGEDALRVHRWHISQRTFAWTIVVPAGAIVGIQNASGGEYKLYGDQNGKEHWLLDNSYYLSDLARLGMAVEATGFNPGHNSPLQLVSQTSGNYEYQLDGNHFLWPDTPFQTPQNWRDEQRVVWKERQESSPPDLPYLRLTPQSGNFSPGNPTQDTVWVAFDADSSNKRFRRIVYLTDANVEQPLFDFNGDFNPNPASNPFVPQTSVRWWELNFYL